MPKMTQKQAILQMYAALKRIKAYQSPQSLHRTAGKDYGLSGEEAIEMAYENVLGEAQQGLKGLGDATINGLIS